MRGNGHNRDGKKHREKGWTRPGIIKWDVAAAAKAALEALFIKRPEYALLHPGDLVEYHGSSYVIQVGIFIRWKPKHPKAFNQTPNCVVFGPDGVRVYQAGVGYLPENKESKLNTLNYDRIDNQVLRDERKRLEASAAR